MHKGYLLDTHAFLWWHGDHHLLSERAGNLIAGEPNLFLSAASAWEIETKYRLGRLPTAKLIVDDWDKALGDSEIQVLSISFEHSILAGQFQADHGDPFDRMLAAQSQLENLALITRDKAFSAFSISTVW